MKGKKMSFIRLVGEVLNHPGVQEALFRSNGRRDAREGKSPSAFVDLVPHLAKPYHDGYNQELLRKNAESLERLSKK